MSKIEQQKNRNPSRRSLRSLDALNVFLADVPGGVGPYLSVYLKSSQGWNPAQIGLVLSASAIATVLAQTPAGALVDALQQKRLLLVIAGIAISVSCICMVMLPIFLLAFAVLPIRGILYTLSNNPYFLVSVQILDGVAGGIFGVLSVLMIADITRGTGRFNLTLGLLNMSIGIGAGMSNALTGLVVSKTSYNVGFLMLAAIATVALVVFWFFVPETRPRRILST